MKRKNVLYYCLYAENQEDAIEKACQAHQGCCVGEATLDEVWQNLHRWRVEIFAQPPMNIDAAEAARERSVTQL